jgi:hypothetical protein
MLLDARSRGIRRPPSSPSSSPGAAARPCKHAALCPGNPAWHESWRESRLFAAPKPSLPLRLSQSSIDGDTSVKTPDEARDGYYADLYQKQLLEEELESI